MNSTGLNPENKKRGRLKKLEIFLWKNWKFLARIRNSRNNKSSSSHCDCLSLFVFVCLCSSIHVFVCQNIHLSLSVCFSLGAFVSLCISLSMCSLRLYLWLLSQPNINPNNKTTKTVVGLKLSNCWDPPTHHHHHTNPKL